MMSNYRMAMHLSGGSRTGRSNSPRLSQPISKGSTVTR